MRVTGPNDLIIESTVDDIITQLEAKFEDKKNLLIDDGIVRIVVQGNFSTEDRQKVALQYRSMGWDIVSHVSSFEIGQPPGTTLFTFVKLQ